MSAPQPEKMTAAGLGRLDRIPVSTLADLATLDIDEIVEGYRDGLDDAPEPGGNRSRAYWHGWRNGMMDKGRLPHDRASGLLVSEYVACSRNCDGKSISPPVLPPAGATGRRLSASLAPALSIPRGRS